MNKFFTAHRIFIILMLAALIAFLSQVGEIPPEAKAYPLVFIIVGIAMALVLIFRKKQPEVEALDKGAIIKIFSFAVVIFIYLMLMSKVGYIISTLLFMYVGEWMLKLKKGVLFVVFPIVLTLVLYLLFTRVLSVILPMGTWIGINF